MTNKTGFGHLLKGISITDYRSVGETQLIAPLGKINLFVGPNNSGKSNILRFVNDNLNALLKKIVTNDRSPLKPDPHAVRQTPTRAGLAVSAPLTSIQNLWNTLHLHPNMQQFVSRVHETIAPNDVLLIDEAWPGEAVAMKRRNVETTTTGINCGLTWLTRKEAN
jgi:hypothetical protein